MPDMEYWKQRARDAENKLLELGHKGVDKAKDLTGKARDGTKRGVDMGLTKGGANLDEPLLPQITEPLGRGVDAARRGVDKGLTKGGANLDEPLLPQIGAAAKPTLDAGAQAVGKGI